MSPSAAMADPERDESRQRRSNARVGLTLAAFAVVVCVVFMFKIFLSSR